MIRKFARKVNAKAGKIDPLVATRRHAAHRNDLHPAATGVIRGMTQTQPSAQRPPADPHVPTSAPPRTPMRALWVLTLILVAIEALLQLSDAGLPGVSRQWAFTYGAFWKPLVTGEVQPVFAAQPVTMFLSHAFLHGSAVHVAMNSVVLLSVGKLVVTFCGQARMLALFAITAIAGGAGFALLGPNATVPMIGASGAVFGFMAAWKRWEFDALRRTGRSTAPVFKFIGTLAILNLVLQFGLGGTLAWEAHLGGALAGWVIAPWLLRR